MRHICDDCVLNSLADVHRMLQEAPDGLAVMYNSHDCDLQAAVLIGHVALACALQCMHLCTLQAK